KNVAFILRALVKWRPILGMAVAREPGEALEIVPVVDNVTRSIRGDADRDVGEQRMIREGIFLAQERAARLLAKGGLLILQNFDPGDAQPLEERPIGLRNPVLDRPGNQPRFSI